MSFKLDLVPKSNIKRGLFSSVTRGNFGKISSGNEVPACLNFTII